MKKRLPTLILTLCFLIGLALLLYPQVSNWWNARHASHAIVDYDAAKNMLSAADYSQLFRKAEDYNEQIRQTDFPFMYHDKVAGYDDILNPDGTGISPSKKSMCSCRFITGPRKEYCKKLWDI